MVKRAQSDPTDRRGFLSGTLGGMLAISLAGSAATAVRAAEGDRAQQETALPCRLGRTLFENPLAEDADVRGFRMEGPGVVSFPRGRMRMENGVDIDLEDTADSQVANSVFWCPESFPADVEISWDFWPIREPGLCILFFSATGRNGEDLFDPSLAPRKGPYKQYHHGDINALHVSYFRHRKASERALQRCNLRKSYGFHLVAEGADPLPSVPFAQGPYRIRIVKFGADVAFHINELTIFTWHDDDETYGPVLGGGKIGFRQMAPMMAEYANLTVRATEPLEG